ncbi:MAG: hypothetical protein AB1393_03755 [Candidatus Edwardsbacteria bacterium]
MECQQKRALFFFLLSILLFFTGTWVYATKYGTMVHGYSEGRFLFPTISAIALYYILGIKEIIPEPLGNTVLTVVFSILFLYDLSILLMLRW